MSNLFKGLKPDTKLARNGFSLSQKHVFSSRPGIAVPCLCVETVPRDHIEIDVTNLTRTMTLSTASFIRGKFNFDFFFVPYSQLWHPFNQFIDQRKDAHSALQKGINYVPTVKLGDVLMLIWKSYRGYVVGSPYSDFHQSSQDIFGYPWAMNALRLLDMLGYGAYYKILSYKTENEVTPFLNQYSGIYVNVFRLAAYQHIWYDFYRNKYFDVDTEYKQGLVQGLDYVRYWNLDDIDCSSIGSSHIPVNINIGAANDNDRIYGLLQQRYVQYKRDLFTSVMPSTQFGAVSSVSFNDIRINGSNGDGEDAPLVVNGTSVEYTDSDSTTQREFTIPSAFDVLQLRKAQLLQRWKQLTLRAGNMVDDNFRAHFGVTPHYESDNNVMYLGSHSSDLQVNPVEATSAAEGVEVGALGATGTAVASGRKIVFDLKDNGDYGIIMCICSFIPENEYNALMLDKANRLYEQFDFFTPEFQNVGLEAISRADFDFSLFPAKRNDVLGYAPRYSMYKTALDKVHGNFIDEEIFGNADTVGLTPGVFKHWTAPRHESFYFDDAELKNNKRALCTFYVSPSILNNVFAIQISPQGTQDCDQANDPFVTNVYFDVKAIRPMSSLGLPEF